MDMCCFLVHMQHSRNYIISSIGLTEPVNVILAPFIQSAPLLYLLHIGMGASEDNADGLYLILAILTPESCRIKAVLV